MNPTQLLAQFEKIADAPDAIPRLRRFILDLAVRGKLVPQDTEDEPAAELLTRIEREKAKLIRAGQIKTLSALPTLGKTDIPFELPATWIWVRLGTVFEYDAGTKRAPKELLQDRWLLELEDIEKDSSVVLTRLRVRDRDSLSTKSEFEVGDILYGKLRPYLNKVVVANEPGYSTTEIVSIRPYVKLCPEYCAIALRRPDFVAYVERLGRGTKMPRLRTPDAVVAAFPLPPLAEQRRIVARVDELMALCDRLEAARGERETRRDRLAASSLARLNTPDPHSFQDDARFALDMLPALTTRPDQVKQLRQTILNLAVRGKLVPQRDGSVQIGGEGKKATETKEPFLLPLGWRFSEFRDLATFENGDRGKNYPNRFEYVKKGIAWINTGHIQPNGLLAVENMHFISRAKYDSLGGGKIKKGDLVYCLRGATFGKTAFVEPYIEGAIASSLMIIRPGPSIDRRFLYFYLISPLGKSQLMRFDNGTAQPNLSSGNVKRYLVTVPPLAEQHLIVAKVDSLMGLCDRLEASLTAGEECRSGLLTAALGEALHPAEARDEAA